MRKKNISILLALLIVFALLLTTNRCTKDLSLPSDQGTPDSVYVETRVGDVVSNFKAISVQVTAAELQNVNDMTDKTGWRPLKLAPKGSIELQKLALKDTVLALTRLYTGSLLQLRLTFADNMKLIVKGGPNAAINVTMVKNVAIFPLSQQLVKGCDYIINVNMNTSKSITTTGPGKYQFDPSQIVISPVPVTGSIYGEVSPVLSDPNVFALLNGKDTIGGTLINPDGHFLLRGLIPGKYTVTFQPLNGYSTATKSASVTAGAVTSLGSVSLN